MKKILFLLCFVSVGNSRGREDYQQKINDLKNAISRGDVTYVKTYVDNKKKRRLSIAELESTYSSDAKEIDSEEQEASLIELAKLCLFDREKALRMAQEMDPYSQLAMGTTCVAVAIAHVSSNYYCSSQQKDSSAGSKSQFASVAQNAMSPFALATVGLKLVLLGATGLRRAGERDNAAAIVTMLDSRD